MVMFSNIGKTFDVITLFHKPSVPASVRVLTLLKQVSAHASETATEDQAADHTAQNKLQRTEFTLDVTEEPPTTDQAKSILEYIGVQNTGKLVEGAMSESDAMKKLREDSKKLKWPVTVDWSNGRAAVGDSESEIMKMIAQLPKETDKV